MSFQSVVDDYAVWHEISGHSPKIIQWYRWMLTVFAQWLERNGRGTHLAAITIPDARAFLKAEAERTEVYGGASSRPRLEKPLSDRTLHGYARAIRAFFRWCTDEGYLSTNPMECLKPPTLEKRAKQVLSVADVERLFAEINTNTLLGARMYAMLAIFYDSGVRLNELVGLNLTDVDWQAFQMRVRGKGKQHRQVPFGAATHRALHKYLLLREQFAMEGEPAVFISTCGSRLGDDATYHLIKRLGERAGIPRLHPHLLVTQRRSRIL